MVSRSAMDKPAGFMSSDLSPNERQLLEEVLHALRRIRFGSVMLTVHDGRVVEIHKTEKIRKSG